MLEDIERKTIDPETIDVCVETCGQCGTLEEGEHTCSIEIARGKWENLCEGCEQEIVQYCKICGEETHPAQISNFIVLKTEAAATMNFLPGIYRVVDRPFYYSSMIGAGHINRNNLLFLDRLPLPDESYNISGHICRGCAAPFAKIWRETYQRAQLKGFRAQVVSERETRIQTQKARRAAEGIPSPEHWDEPYEPLLN